MKFFMNPVLCSQIITGKEMIKIIKPLNKLKLKYIAKDPKK
nr:hypothetical protein [Mycoplasma anserisalpingitidis]